MAVRGALGFFGILRKIWDSFLGGAWEQQQWNKILWWISCRNRQNQGIFNSWEFCFIHIYSTLTNDFMQRTRSGLHEIYTSLLASTYLTWFTWISNKGTKMEMLSMAMVDFPFMYLRTSLLRHWNIDSVQESRYGMTHYSKWPEVSRLFSTHPLLWSWWKTMQCAGHIWKKKKTCIFEPFKDSWKEWQEIPEFHSPLVESTIVNSWPESAPFYSTKKKNPSEARKNEGMNLQGVHAGLCAGSPWRGAVV